MNGENLTYMCVCHTHTHNGTLLSHKRNDFSTCNNMDRLRGDLVKVTQLSPTLCARMNYIVHGVLQDRILEWVAISFPTQGLNPGLPHCKQILEGIRLSEINQTEKDKYCMISLICGI